MSFNGGYDEGYRASACFWGASPGSLIRDYLAANSVHGLKVLDLGCGEGKNANAFVNAGAKVDAVDCSEHAIANGRAIFIDENINWRRCDAISYLERCGSYDIIIMYGLLHCLASMDSIAQAIKMALIRTKPQGLHFVVAFNDGPHDLSAHPHFNPTLAAHGFYLEQYRGHNLLAESNSLLHEVHPHNNIPHFHSLTRLLVGVQNEVP